MSDFLKRILEKRDYPNIHTFELFYAAMTDQEFRQSLMKDNSFPRGDLGKWIKDFKKTPAQMKDLIIELAEYRMRSIYEAKKLLENIEILEDVIENNEVGQPLSNLGKSLKH
ncbi:hypothetical protein [Terasakiella sp.]|uniref:hypothetical protein n=1 Tax=Terasakiella sp. TaxID=2034861 RepID=UPI003AA89756